MKKNLGILKNFSKNNFNKIQSYRHSQNIITNNIKKTLEQEINFSEKNNPNTNFIKEFLLETKFNLSENPNSNKFLLVKNEGKFLVEVSCNSRAAFIDNEEIEENGNSLIKLKFKKRIIFLFFYLIN